MDLVIHDPKVGRVDLSWVLLKRIEFKSNPGSKLDSRRLYGTVETRQRQYEGFIVWDRDETLAEEKLDGEVQGKSRSIPFADIREIRPADHDSSHVTLKDGSTLTVAGTNDVGEGHRGVAVIVAGVGVAELSYENVTKVTFRDPPPSPAYAVFTGGAPLRGTVRLRDGNTVQGEIVWDLDEKFSWETLDGHAVGVEYSVPFENIRSIKPLDERSAQVLLAGGESLTLYGTNDVDGTNRGVRVTTAAGTIHELGWAQLESVQFETSDHPLEARQLAP